MNKKNLFKYMKNHQQIKKLYNITKLLYFNLDVAYAPTPKKHLLLRDNNETHKC